MARISEYSIQLPRKIIYAEREFRHFCHNIYLNQQIVNHEYNLANNKVRPNGFLTRDAYRCPVTPIIFERSVVTSDQCPFCLKRGFKNLGRHMAMQHGGQAKIASHSRFEEGVEESIPSEK